MPTVRQLPPDVVSRIAAGEVIERPASVLKELLENALDAGAKRVTVETLGSGRKLLRVSDDGCGMAPADCRAAFERHTTSKISRFSDIDTLSTFGFRGEALFSIAAVAKVRLTSCCRGRGSRKGWLVETRGGKLAADREAPPTEGTAVEVRDLFFNTPARAKFLKSDASERSHLLRVVEEAALANPRVGFTFKSEGRAVLRFAAQKASGSEALRQRAREVLGERSGGDLIAAERRGEDLSIEALLSPADSLASSRTRQYCLVNRRPVSSRTVQQAMYRAYEPFRAKNRHPAAVICLTLPPDRIDVNVHPTKREIRFRKDAAIFETVTRTLAKALMESRGIPSQAAPPLVQRAAPLTAVPDRTAELVADTATVPEVRRTAPARHDEARPWFPKELRYLGQIESSYLVFDDGGGLLVIDQHAAQERVLFERYLAEIESGKVAVQKLMLPLAIELPASAIQSVLSRKKRLKRAGFAVEPFGKTSLHVTGVPALFHKAGDVKDMVHGLLDELRSPGAAAADARYDATATIACKAAVKAHDPLSGVEAVRLVQDLRRCRDGSCCPHGRPTTVALSRDELARRFKRPGAPPL